jgi:hypothetical protein
LLIFGQNDCNPRPRVRPGTAAEPAPVNALSPELIASLLEAIRTAPHEGKRALVLSGLPGIFSAGLDVPQLLKLDRLAMDALWREFYALIGALAHSGRVTPTRRSAPCRAPGRARTPHIIGRSHGLWSCERTGSCGSGCRPRAQVVRGLACAPPDGNGDHSQASPRRSRRRVWPRNRPGTCRGH